MKTLMRNGRDRRSENPRMCHARKERVLLFRTDQRITSGPAARTAAFRGRIHGCTRTLRKNVRFFSSIHGTEEASQACPQMSFDWGASDFSGDTVFGPSMTPTGSL